MKKYVVEFLKRGLLAAAGGPVVLGVIYGILGATDTVTALIPQVVCREILSITLMAFIAAGITMIYMVEELPLLCAILLHGGVLYLDYLLMYLLNHWIPQGEIGLFTVMFFGGFVLVWVVIYLCIRNKTRKINEKIRCQKE